MRYRKFYMSAMMAILTIFFGYFVKIPIHAEDSGYTVTIPTAISYSAVNAGRVNETTPYNVKVDGTLADSKAVQLTADTNSGHLTAKGGETLDLSVKQNKSMWAPDETTGDGTTSSDSATVSGTAKTAGEYNGNVLYTSNVIANTKQYTAFFDENGGSDVKETITKVGGQALGTLPTTTRTGYEFLGWYTAKDGGLKISDQTTMPATKNGTTYYAHWQVHNHIVHFDVNGGDSALPYSITRDYGQQIGWDTVNSWGNEMTPPYGGGSTENSMSKEVINDPQSSDGKAIKLTRLATTGLGWYYGSASSPTLGGIPVGFRYTITIRAKGKGIWLIGSEQNGEHEIDLTSEYQTYTWSFVAGDTKYKALVVYNQHGNRQAGDVGDYIQFYDYSCVQVGGGTNLATASRTGYTFDGWYTQKSGGTKATGTETMPDSDVTYYAHWKPNTYTISFNANSGAGTMANQTLTYDKDTALKTNTFTKDGYAFVGWNTKADGTGTSYADKSSVKNLATSGTVTLYAQWTKVYTIDYDLDGGKWTDGTTPVSSYTQLTDDFTLPIPQKDGYGFAGWTTDNNATHNANGVIKKGSTGNRSYTAVWSQDMVSVVCEDWTVDYNGNPYKKMGTVATSLNVANGSSISSEAFGSDFTWHQDDTMYKIGHYETKTVTTQDPVVRRYFVLTSSSPIHFWKYTGGGVSVTFDATVEYYDSNKNLIHTETRSQISNTNGQDANLNNIIPENRGNQPDGTIIRISNIQVVSPVDYVLYQSNNNTRTYIFRSSNPTDIANEQYAFTIQHCITRWDDTSKVFRGKYWQSDGSANQAIKSKTYLFTYPDGTTAIHSATEQRSYTVQNGTVVKVMDNELNPGWLQTSEGMSYYGGGIGNRHTTIYQGGVVDAPTHDDLYIYQDAYGITFNANGGTGNMDNICISNIAADDDRKLTANAFTKQNMTFQGWATSQEDADKGIVTYKDGAVMPIDFGSGSTSTTDRKHTCEMITLYAVWK